MIALASIIERFESAYLAQYQSAILPSHRQALSAMKRCRSTLGPRMLAQCSGCEEQRFVPHSCGHRNCPHCQHFESQQWIERQTQRLVPGSYFLITFTLPAELRPLAWQHQRTLYALLMDCAWQTLRTFSQNHKQLQGSPGAVAVLHTHSRRLEFPIPMCIWPCPLPRWMPTKPCGAAWHPAPRAVAICSTTRRWPSCFAASCWRPWAKRV